MEKKITKIVEIFFIALEIFIFLLYFIPEYFNVKVEYDNFSVLFYFILVIFIESFLFYKQWSKENIIVRAAFLFTLIADYFMTYLDSYYHLSICFFFLAQLMYFILINIFFKKRYLKSSIVIYLIAVPILITVSLVSELFNSLTLVAIIYYSLSVINIIYLLRIKNKTPSINNFLIGLILFILCDTCIGLKNIGFNNYKFMEVIGDLIWIFYAPSQMILVATLKDMDKIKGELYEKNIES